MAPRSALIFPASPVTFRTVSEEKIGKRVEVSGGEIELTEGVLMLHPSRARSLLALNEFCFALAKGRGKGHEDAFRSPLSRSESAHKKKGVGSSCHHRARDSWISNRVLRA